MIRVHDVKVPETQKIICYVKKGGVPSCPNYPCYVSCFKRSGDLNVPIIDIGTFWNSKASETCSYHLHHRTLQEKAETTLAEDTNFA